MATIISIQVGQVKTYEYSAGADGRGRTWQTAFFKSSVLESRHFGELGVSGDEQADHENHGGLDKAVLAYSADHYDYWRETLGLVDIGYGAFGENLTIAGSEESTVCIGDRWHSGEVLFEVSQPRQPCWKLGRRWQVVDLPKRVIQNGRSGWYFRVLNPGDLTAGESIELVSRPRPNWSVARASRLLYHEPDNVAGLQELADVPELSRSWREELLERLARRGA